MALTAGPRSPGTAASVNATGVASWSNPTNVLTQNDSVASVNYHGGAEPLSDYLQATNFGFTLPSGATITGITVEADLNSSFNVGDGAIKLVKAGSIVGSDKGRGDVDWPTSDTDTYVSWGGSTDLWGTTWTATEINASNFGVVIQGNNHSGQIRTLNIDHIRITVTYEAAQEFTLTGIASSEAFGSLALTSNYNVSLTGIPSAEAFGSLSLFTGFMLVGIPSEEAFGTITFESQNAIRLTGIDSAFAAGTLRFLKSKRDKLLAHSVVDNPVSALVSVES